MSSNHADGPSDGTDQPSWGPPASTPGEPPPAPQWPGPQPAYPPQPYSQQAYAHQHGYTPQQDYAPQPAYPPPIYPQQPATPAAGYAPPPVWVPPAPVYPYARWGRRVGAFLIDFAPSYVAMVPFWIGYILFYVRIIQVSSTGSTAPNAAMFGDLLRPALLWMLIGFVLMLAAIGWQWYNRWLIAGRTGQSIGKRVLKVKLVAEVNGQPIGPLNAFLRDLLHIVDGAAYVGYLWPLWDAKRQTFSDMIMKTVVIDAPTGPSAYGPPA